MVHETELQNQELNLHLKTDASYFFKKMWKLYLSVNSSQQNIGSYQSTFSEEQ